MLCFTKIFVFVLLFAENTYEANMKIKVVSLRPCDLPASVMDPDNPVSKPRLTIRKLNRDTTVIDCNITTGSFGPVKLSLRTYQLTPNQRNLMFKLEKLTCNNPMARRVATTIHLNTTKDCIVAAGNYHFENLSPEKFAWFLTTKISPGKYGYEVEFSSPKGVASCTYTVVDLFLPRS